VPVEVEVLVDVDVDEELASPPDPPAPVEDCDVAHAATIESGANNKTERRRKGDDLMSTSSNTFGRTGGRRQARGRTTRQFERATPLAMRPVLRAIFEELASRGRAQGHVHLDDFAEVIGARAVTFEEVESLVDALEGAGLLVGEAPTEADVDKLRAVLIAARSLSSTLGRKPTVEEIASETGLAIFTVRRMLEHGGRQGRVKGPGPTTT
jgi:hypothetical protein